LRSLRSDEALATGVESKASFAAVAEGRAQASEAAVGAGALIRSHQIVDAVFGLVDQICVRRNEAVAACVKSIADLAGSAAGSTRALGASGRARSVVVARGWRRDGRRGDLALVVCVHNIAINARLADFV